MESPTKPPLEDKPAADAAEPSRQTPIWQTRRFRLMLLLVAAAVLVGLLIRIQLPGWMASWNKISAHGHLVEGKLDEALADCNRALYWLPDDPGLYELRARIQRERGDLKAALADYNKLLEVNPNYPNGLLHRSFVYQLLGKHDEAIADAQEAVEWWGREVPQGLNGLAYARAVAGKDLDAALEDANKALNLLDRDKQEKKEKAEESGKKQKAKPRDDDLASFLDTRGYVYFKKEQYKEALADFDKAIAVYTRWRDTHLEQLKNQAAERLQYVEKQWNSTLGLMHHHRGLVYEKLGDADKAKADKEKAQELGYDPKKDGP